jgi:L-lactate dehydrogenase (cytochrome)
VEHGSYDELTLKANRDDLDAIRLRQRVLIDVSKVSLVTSMPGLAGLVHGDGEMLAARAAEAAGIKFCLSTMSICSIEDRAELEVAMTLTGLRDIREVSRAVVA